MGQAEGEALLQRMMDWATQPQFVYRHNGSLATWSCGTIPAPCTRPQPYAEDSGRLLHRTTVLGDEPFDPERELAA